MKKTLIISGSNSELAIEVSKKLEKKYKLIFLYHSKKPKNKNIISIKHSIDDNVENIFKLVNKKSINIHGILHFNGLHNFDILRLCNYTNFLVHLNK